MKRFWDFAETDSGNELRLDGVIAEESWWGDEVTPAQFRAELAEHPGDITVWINSPGGDVIAASSIYTALKEHKGRVVVKIEALAASAASVVAMAGDEVQISPTAYMMIHQPWTMAQGDSDDFRSIAKMLDEITEGIINAYALKSGQSRDKLLRLMEAETWLSAQSAVDLGFADSMLYDDADSSAPGEGVAAAAIPLKPMQASGVCVYAATTETHALIQKIADRLQATAVKEQRDAKARKRCELRMKLMAVRENRR